MTALSNYDVFNSIKADLGIDDDLQDDTLNALVHKVIDHFIFRYGQPPQEKHSFIIEDCVIKRYNRRGAEGMERQTVEGYTAWYAEDAKEFGEWDSELKREFGIDDGKAQVKFL